MNALFLTQSGSLRMFYELMKALRDPLQLERIAFYVAYYPYYQQFCERCPDIESSGYYLLKEWEITRRASNEELDRSLIGRYERILATPNLWGPLVADRRIYMGKKSTFRQDYASRFNHVEMQNILLAGLVDMERLFDQVRPDFVLSFICVTFGEYLAYLFARSRGIPFLNLRPTRIKNYITYGSSIFEPSDRVRAAYQRYLAESVGDEWVERAHEYIAFVQEQHALYEGVRRPTKTTLGAWHSLRPRSVLRVLRRECQYRFGKIRDNHMPGVLVPMFYVRLVNPLQSWWNRRHLAGGYVTEDMLASMDYVFFPLHTEPEVTLLVYSKACLNQIEVIRNLSHSIPVGMKLVVKEHPLSVGKRPLSYYRKLLAIPNVCLADPDLGSRPLVANARLVATIAGSIGWEAVLREKPVVVLGHAPYEFLPASMIRHVTDAERLSDEISDLLENYEYYGRAVTAYIAAIMSQSVPINLYSTLLGREGVYADGGDEADTAEALPRDIELLAQYTVASLRGC